MVLGKDFSNKLVSLLKYHTRVYFTLIFLLFFVILGDFILNHMATQARDEDYAIINLSGRQRMLTQRLNSLIGLHESSVLPVEFNLEQEITKNIQELRYGLQFIENSRFVKENKEINEVYYKEKGVHELTLQLINKVEEFQLAKNQLNRNSYDSDNRKSEIFSLAYVTLLPLLDQVTLMKQKVSEAGFAKQKKINLCALIFSIILVIVEIIFIFTPLVGHLKINLVQIERMYKTSISQARLAALGESLAYVGHELRNSLSLLKGSAEVLMLPSYGTLQLNDAKVQNHTANINKQTEQMNFILKSIKSVSKIADNAEFKEFDLQNAVSEVLRFFTERLKVENVEVVIDSAKLSNAVVLGVPEQMFQVLTNLITNALDSLKITEAKKYINIEIFNSNSDLVILRIQDSGRGVDPLLVDKIFNPFFTTKDADGGTGLGLSVCRQIIESYNGTINLNWHIGASCFEIQLPIVYNSLASNKESKV